MTKKQIELKERLLRTIGKGNGNIKENEDGTKTFEISSEQRTAKMTVKEGSLVEYKISGFDGNGSEQTLKATQVVKFENAVATVEDDIDSAKRMAEYEKMKEEYLAEQERERQARRNAPETVKSDYLDSLIRKAPTESSIAERYVISSYNHSRDNGYKLIDFNDLPIRLENEIEEMVEILDKAQIKEIGISQPSTALINYLSIFDENGWKVNGMFKELKTVDYSKERQEVSGVRLERAA